MFTSAMGVHPLGERPQISLDDFPAAPLPNSVTVIAEPAGGLVVRFPDWNGERRTVLILATVYGLGLLLFVAVGGWPGWVAAVLVFLVALYLFGGFKTWRLASGTATIHYGWGRLASLGLKRVCTGVTSIQYELKAWDTAKGSWHNLNLVSGPRRELVASRTSHEPIRTSLSASTSPSPNLMPELVAVARVLSTALEVPIRVASYTVPAPDPWWAGD